MTTVLLTGKSLKLKVGEQTFTEQTTSCKLTHAPNTDSVELVTGATVEIDKGFTHQLELSALQDWVDPQGLFSLLAEAVAAGTPVDWELTQTAPSGASTSYTGTCQGTLGDFGGDSGALQGDLELKVLTVVGPTHTPASPLADAAQALVAEG